MEMNHKHTGTPMHTHTHAHAHSHYASQLLRLRELHAHRHTRAHAHMHTHTRTCAKAIVRVSFPASVNYKHTRTPTHKQHVISAVPLGVINHVVSFCLWWYVHLFLKYIYRYVPYTSVLDLCSCLFVFLVFLSLLIPKPIENV